MIGGDEMKCKACIDVEPLKVRHEAVEQIILEGCKDKWLEVLDIILEFIVEHLEAHHCTCKEAK